MHPFDADCVLFFLSQSWGLLHTVQSALVIFKPLLRR